MSSFPVGSSVFLRDLVKGAQYNEKKGIVQSSLNPDSGRQEVYLFEANKSISVKPINMMYEPREISSLSITEMKGILMFSKENKEEAVDEREEPDYFRGLDKEQLQQMIADISTSPDRIAALLARSNEPKVLPSEKALAHMPNTNPTFTSDQLRQSAQRMSEMSPKTLRQQAATMKSMGPVALRNMNPQMAHMTDDQINAAISQMEAVAKNPAMMKLAAEQLKNMDPHELQESVGQSALSPPMPSNAPFASTPPSQNTAIPNMAQYQEASQRMSSMSPEQLRSQATLLKSMPFDTLRKTNPHMATMTDDQIRFSISQIEKMADDPAMMKLAAEQMKNMSPEQFESMKKMIGNESGGLNSITSDNKTTAASVSNSQGIALPNDASEMIESLLSSPEQMSSMIRAMKENPDLVKQMLSSQIGSVGDSPVSDARKKQIEEAIDQFSQMDEKQFKRYLRVATTVQRCAKPVLSLWNKTRRALGISSKNLLIFINAVILLSFVLLVQWKRANVRNEEEALDSLLLDAGYNNAAEFTSENGDGEF